MNSEYEYNGRLMGCDLAVSIVSDTKEAADAAYAHVAALGMSFEKMFSRFIPHSELSKINAIKSGIVSPLFLEMFALGAELYHDTDGVFNPLLQISAHGYDKDFAIVGNTIRKKNITHYDTNIHSVIVDPHQSIITIGSTQALDFGGFLKGHVAEVMCKKLGNFPGAIVNIGGDIYAHGYDANDKPFIFGIYNPTTDNYDINIQLHNQSLATSGNYKRVWKTDNGSTTFHILAPNGQTNPDTDIVSASILGSHGYQTDGYATTALSLGSAYAKQFLDDRGMKYVLIANDGIIMKNI